MNKSININSKGEVIKLKARRYRIYILGGWGIKKGTFAISFINKDTNEIIKCEDAGFPVQAYAFRKRAKRIFIVDIPRSAEYEVIFENPESLSVTKMNLLIGSMFLKPLPNKNLEVLISSQLGIFPIIS